MDAFETKNRRIRNIEKSLEDLMLVKLEDARKDYVEIARVVRGAIISCDLTLEQKTSLLSDIESGLLELWPDLRAHLN